MHRDTEIEVIFKEMATGGELAYDIAVGYVWTIIVSIIVILIFVIALVIPVKTILGGKSSRR